ncbi:hypothetical protein HYW76_04545 [Candidatus Pacearchaeota archaeon]|nr:hypothetical protein [Candidatus Pacearchaeota archaeon]
MKSPQEAANEVRNVLEDLIFLGHVHVRAGQLREVNKKTHYRAVFVFTPKDEGKTRKLKGYLEGRNYHVRFEFDRYSPTGMENKDLWRIVMISSEGKPYEQEEGLVHALMFVKKDIEGYRE